MFNVKESYNVTYRLTDRHVYFWSEYAAEIKCECREQ